MRKFKAKYHDFLSRRKKILAWTVKISIGIFCFGIIYMKMSYGQGNLNAIKQLLEDPAVWTLVGISALLMPLNWGIEAYKWQMITERVERIGFLKAFKSVLAGVCFGNLAPGRSTEFVAKIMFFQPPNRAMISVLHFVNGMIQLSVTIIAGLAALVFRMLHNHYGTGMLYAIIAFALILLVFFITIMFRFNRLQAWLFSIRWLQKYKPAENIVLPGPLLLGLFIYSCLRYSVFVVQFYLLFCCLSASPPLLFLLGSIAIYFMITSIIPMISVIEPAIRAGVALFVFSNAHINALELVTVSTLLWLINIVLPSLMGYLVILKEKFIIRIKPA